MNYTAAPTPILVLFAALAGAAVCSPAAAQGSPPDLKLPDGEDSREFTTEAVYHKLVGPLLSSLLGSPRYAEYLVPTGHGYLFPGGVFSVTASGPVELIMVLSDGTDTEVGKEDSGGWGWEMALSDDPSATSKAVPVGTIYRMVLRDPDHFLVGLHFSLDVPEDLVGSTIDGQQIDVATLPEYLESGGTPPLDFDLTIILRRLTRTCSMWARVSGDVNDTFFGNVAYYNFAVDGMFVDPGLMRLMGIDPDSAPEGEDSFSAFIKKETRATGNFALSLRDFKLDQEFDTLSEEGDAVKALLGLGNSKDVEAVRQVVGMLNNQFALSMAAAVDSLPKPGEGGEKSAVTIQLTGVRATVGAVAEGGRIPFELVPGTPSAATLLLAVDKPRDLVSGTFLGDLYTKGAYTLRDIPDPRQLHVHIEANFTALEGQNTCVMAIQPG